MRATGPNPAARMCPVISYWPERRVASSCMEPDIATYGRLVLDDADGIIPDPDYPN